MADQLLGLETHHLAKGGIHIGDAPRQIARAHADGQRILHRLAKGIFGAQGLLGPHAPSHLPPRREETRARHQGQHGDRRENARLRLPRPRPIQGDQQRNPLPRRVERHAVRRPVGQKLAGIGQRLGFRRQRLPVGIEQAQPVALREPPGHMLGEQGLQRNIRHQRAIIAPLPENRRDQRQMGRIMRSPPWRLRNAAIGRPPQRPHFGKRQTANIQPAALGKRRKRGIHRPARAKPAQPRKVGIARQHLPGFGLETKG